MGLLCSVTGGEIQQRAGVHHDHVPVHQRSVRGASQVRGPPAAQQNTRAPNAITTSLARAFPRPRRPRGRSWGGGKLGRAKSDGGGGGGGEKEEGRKTALFSPSPFLSPPPRPPSFSARPSFPPSPRMVFPRCWLNLSRTGRLWRHAFCVLDAEPVSENLQERFLFPRGVVFCLGQRHR